MVVESVAEEEDRCIRFPAVLRENPFPDNDLHPRLLESHLLDQCCRNAYDPCIPT